MDSKKPRCQIESALAKTGITVRSGANCAGSRTQVPASIDVETLNESPEFNPALAREADYNTTERNGGTL